MNTHREEPFHHATQALTRPTTARGNAILQIPLGLLLLHHQIRRGLGVQHSTGVSFVGGTTTIVIVLFSVVARSGRVGLGRRCFVG